VRAMPNTPAEVRAGVTIIAEGDGADEARALFERLLTYGGRLGLFSEEIDSHDSVAVGNYPQAFTHIALINSAINLQKAVEHLNEHYSEPIMAAITVRLQA